MDEDVWKSGDAGDEAEEGGIGVLEQDSAMPLSMAFHPGRFFTNGATTFMQAPVLLLVTGVVLWLLLTVLPMLVTIPINVAVVGMIGSGAVDENVGQVINQGVSLGLRLLLLPVQLLVSAGALVGVGKQLRDGEVELSVLWGSIGPAVNAFLYGLLSAVVQIVTVMPIIGLAAALSYGAVVALGDSAMIAVALIILAMVAAIFVWAVMVGGRLIIGQYGAVLDGTGPMETLQNSWKRTDGMTILWLIVNSFLLGILGMIGGCLCVGSIPVFGFQIACFGTAYLLGSRSEAELNAWVGVKDGNMLPWGE